MSQPSPSTPAEPEQDVPSSEPQGLLEQPGPKYVFPWFDKWLLAIPILCILVSCLLAGLYFFNPPTAPVTAINAPAAATQPVGEPLTITGTAPPNSSVKIYNGDQLVAETQAGADGNFVVRFMPTQPGEYKLRAVAESNGTTTESAQVLVTITGTVAAATNVLATPAPNATRPAAGPTETTASGQAATAASSGPSPVAGATTAAGTAEAGAGTTTSPAGPVTAINAPAAATQPVGEPLTITGTAPPNSSVKIYNGDQLVAETQAGADGNFVVRFLPTEPGEYVLRAVAESDGTRTESAEVVITVGEAAPPAEMPGAAETSAATETNATLSATAAANETAVPPGTGETPTTAEASDTGIPTSAASEATAQVPGAGETPTAGAVSGATPSPSALVVTVSIEPNSRLEPDALLSGTASPDAQVVIYLNDIPTGTTRADANGKWELVMPHNLNSGNYVLRVVVVDSEGKAILASSEGIQVSVGVGMILPVTGGVWYR